VVSLQFSLLCPVRIDLANSEHLVSHWGREETRQKCPRCRAPSPFTGDVTVIELDHSAAATGPLPARRVRYS
jgi:hypothetical protein